MCCSWVGYACSTQTDYSCQILWSLISLVVERTASDSCRKFLLCSSFLPLPLKTENRKERDFKRILCLLFYTSKAGRGCRVRSWLWSSQMMIMWLQDAVIFVNIHQLTLWSCNQGDADSYNLEDLLLVFFSAVITSAIAEQVVNKRGLPVYVNDI